MRFIPTRLHALADYAVGVVLIALPFLLGMPAGQRWLLCGIGVFVVGYSLITDYELGAARILPVPTHLVLDAVVGVALLASPWLTPIPYAPVWPNITFGLLSLIFAATTQRTRAS